MKKIFIIILTLFSLGAAGQIPNFPNYTSINQGYHWYRGVFNQLHVPGFNGTPTLRTGQWIGDGAIGIDTTGNKFYFYTNTTWRELFKASDTTNKWVQRVYVRTDSLFEYKNGVETFITEVGAGAGGGVPDGRTITINGVTFDLSANRSWTVGDLFISDTAAMLGVYLRANVAAATYTPLARTITINGTTLDLSANRSWSVGDVLTTGSYSNPAWITTLAWSKITGITGTPDGTKFLRDDGSWQVPAGGGGGAGKIGAINNYPRVANTLQVSADTIYAQTSNYDYSGMLDKLKHLDFDGRLKTTSYTSNYGEATPLYKNNQWTLKNATVWPDGATFRDGSNLFIHKGIAYLRNGWFNNGITYVTDSIMRISDDRTTATFVGLMPMKGHSIAGVTLPNLGNVVLGNDDNATSTERKSVWYLPPGSDVVTGWTLQTDNWALGDRVLPAAAALPNGWIIAGGGQTDASDSTTVLSDMWISYDFGVTWTQIQTGVWFLGGNSQGRWHVLDNRLHVFGRSTQDADIGDRAYWDLHLSIALEDIEDETKWRTEEDIPHAASYQSMAQHDGEFWIIAGSNNVDGNTKWVDKRSRNGVWRTYNAFNGQNPLDLTFAPTHAAAILSHNGELLFGPGNTINSLEVLAKSEVEFIASTSTYKNIVGNMGIGNDGYNGHLYMNLTDPGYMPANYTTYFKSSALAPTDRFGFESTWPDVINLITSVTDNVIGINFNGRMRLYAGMATVGSGLADGIGVFEPVTSHWKFWIRPDGSVRLHNGATSVPTRVSALEVPGIDEIGDTVNKRMAVYDISTGGIYHTALPVVSTTATTIQSVATIDADTPGNIAIRSSDNTLWYKSNGYWYSVAKTDSISARNASTTTYLNAVSAAGGSFTSGEADAIDTWIKGLKDAGIWDDLGYLYIHFGGVEASHAINVFNPGTFNLTFTGSWTFNAAGSKNSTGEYANTGYSIATQVGDNNVSLAFMSNENVGNGNYDQGVYNASGAKEISLQSYTGAGSVALRIGSNSNQILVSYGSGLGLFTGVRISATEMRLYNGDIELGVSTTSDTQLPTGNMFLGTGNIDGTPNFEALHNHALDALWTRGLTPTEVANLNTLTTALMAGIGR